MAFDPANHRSLVGLAADLARRLKTAGFGLDSPPSPPPPDPADNLQLGETVVVEGPWRAGRRTEH